jgi:hypothetical protein
MYIPLLLWVHDLLISVLHAPSIRLIFIA